MEKIRFKSIRFKNIKDIHNAPDYSNVIKINKTYFTLTGYLERTSSDINYVLEKITRERIERESYTRSAYIKYLEKERGTNR